MIANLSNVHTEIIQYISITASLLFIGLIIELIRKRKIKEEYALLWFFLGLVFLALSIWRKSLEIISYGLGIAYAPAALFLIIIAVLIAILIHFSIAISKLKENNKILIQEIGLVQLDIKNLKEKKREN